MTCDRGYVGGMPSTDQDPALTTRFGSLRIAYDDQVLTPREWTTWQSRWAADLAAGVPAGPMLELCCGAGQIGLLAVAHSDRDLVAVDLSEAACSYAERNAKAAGLADRVEVRNSALESACSADEVFPLIIADPPWVPAETTGTFPEDPLSAIDGGPDGLEVARACLVVIDDHLDRDGAALLQVGSTDQVDLLRDELPSTLEISEVRTEPGRGAVALIIRT